MNPVASWRGHAVTAPGIAGWAGIAGVVAASWYYVWTGAGTGMSALAMTAATLFPHRLDSAGAMALSLPAVIVMWWIMMIAMMTPSALPLILLYRRVIRHRGASESHTAVLSLCLLAGYLCAWLAFSIGASWLQMILQPRGLISAMMLWSKSAVLSAVVLAMAGIYQFTPLKRACLKQCRSPVNFLIGHGRPGVAGGFLLGVRHGMYCVGCCWLLMALLFVGGVMNVLWIAALSLIVFVEKVLPGGERIGHALGVALIVWAGATLLV
ncbi:DUF2182 domain-containing protein [Paraburkholderia sacchari]|uniref:DUF2182 domain-containing protein n=1 Tax=Paraburkholderia sacchari TaxID=159450 RepID=UPI0005425C14|nr:DUF2182 domain-containing protein [Paraburkholderia sacchari]NLP60737.1 DUF2182 domain-containing protein [Paraburkholderia sacchari]